MIGTEYEYMASIMIPTKNNTGATNHGLDSIAGLGCPCGRGRDLAGVGVIGAKRHGASEEQSKREEREVSWMQDHEKPVITAKLPGVMKESGEGNGVVYVDGSGDALKDGVFGLIEVGVGAECGPGGAGVC
jgi:hypothetical protein